MLFRSDEFHLEDSPHMDWRKRQAMEDMFRPSDDYEWGEEDDDDIPWFISDDDE